MLAAIKTGATPMRRLASLLVLVLFAHPAFAFDGCRLLTRAPAAVPVSAAVPQLTRGETRLTFVGHATFLIESARGVTVETDYNDYVRSGVTPTVATMNRAHSTHYSNAPDPGIAHLLRGWDPDGRGPANHDLEVLDVRVRNVSTNIRDFGGMTRADSNSIFVVESAGVCIAHLGHLHHTLSREHLRELGRIDVLLVPVDGFFTLDMEGIVAVVRELQAAIVVPMHFFNRRTLDRFVERIRAYLPVETAETSSIVLSRARLAAAEPRVLLMPGTHPRYDFRAR